MRVYSHLLSVSLDAVGVVQGHMGPRGGGDYTRSASARANTPMASKVRLEI